MRVHRFYIGQQTSDGKPVHQIAWNAIEDKLRGTFGGYTRFNALGEWVDGSGKIYTELSYVFECATDCESSFRGLAKDLAKLASQQCVLYTYHDVVGEFVNV